MQKYDCIEMNSNEFAYILYTSGTTGFQKDCKRYWWVTLLLLNGQ